MTAEGHKVASLHGAKDASERDAIIDSFREGREKVLITTNVIARGIDILQVNMVVNYDLPLLNERDNHRNKSDARPDIETYIHRIGAFPSHLLHLAFLPLWLRVHLPNCYVRRYEATPGSRRVTCPIVAPCPRRLSIQSRRGGPSSGAGSVPWADAVIRQGHGSGRACLGSKESAPMRPLASVRAGRRRSSGADPGRP